MIKLKRKKPEDPFLAPWRKDNNDEIVPLRNQAVSPRDCVHTEDITSKINNTQCPVLIREFKRNALGIQVARFIIPGQKSVIEDLEQQLPEEHKEVNDEE